MPIRTAATLLALCLTAVPLGALAQSNAQPETLTGNIASVDDASDIQLNDDRGYLDVVHLQPGVAIDPPGTQLAPGMNVRINGFNGGHAFEATNISIMGGGPPPPQQPDAPLRPPRDTQPPPPQDGLPAQFATAGDLTGTLDAQLDSKSAYVGQSVRLLNVSSYDRSIAGATMIGTVTEVQRPGQGRSAQIEIHFDRLILPNGPAYPIDGVVASMQVKTKNNTLKELGGALAGMLAGNAIG